jgi:iron-sulfur cluster repair protein YtfE (RIC family)
MKRAPELQPLSREHRDALILARRLRRSGEGIEPLPAALDHLTAAWRERIQPHFREEEELLLPAFAAVAGVDHALIVRTLTEHAALRLTVRQIAAGGDPSQLAVALGRMLDDHIRFEERVLFPAIEAALPPEALAALGEEIEAWEAGGIGCGIHGG